MRICIKAELRFQEPRPIFLYPVPWPPVDQRGVRVIGSNDVETAPISQYLACLGEKQVPSPWEALNSDYRGAWHTTYPGR